MFKVMFVCTGNICRSSMAEEMMKSLLKEKGLEDRFSIYSSGTAVDKSRAASDNAISALKEIGLDLTAHRSKHTSRELIDKADLVLAMTGIDVFQHANLTTINGHNGFFYNYSKEDLPTKVKHL